MPFLDAEAGGSRFSQQLKLALGPQLYGAPVFIGTFLLSLMVRVVGVPGEPELNFWQSITATVLAQIAVYLCLITITRTLTFIPGMPIALTALSVVLAGAMRGVVIEAFVTWQTGVDPQLLLMRAGAGAAIVGIALLIVSYTVGVFQARMGRLRQLRIALSSLEEVLSHNQERIETWYRGLVQNIQAMLLDRMHQKRLLESADLAESLKQLVSEVVRPLSHQLMLKEPNWQPSENAEKSNRTLLAKLFRMAIEFEWKAHPLLVSISCALAGFSLFVQFAGFAKLPLYLVAVFLTFVGYSIANQIYSKIPHQNSAPRRLGGYILLMTVAGYPASFFALTVVNFGGGVRGLFAAAAFAACLMFISLLISFSFAATEAIRIDEINLENANAELKWLVARSNAVMWERQQALSRFLHGPVQSSISAAAIKLDMASEESADLEVLAREARLSIADAVESLTHPMESGIFLHQGLQSVIKGWAGVCAIQVEMPVELQQELDLDSSCARVTLDIVQEAVSNAIRHGHAKHVTAKIERIALEQLQITVTDDGVGVAESATPGLGTKLLQDCSLEWSRSNKNPGTELFCRIPIQAQFGQLA